MSKKRKRQNTGDQSIKIVPIELDYERLAEAIICAQEKAKQKNNKRQIFRTALMGNINGMIFITISIFSVLFIIGTWTAYYNGTISSIPLCIIITVLCGFIAIFSFLCQQETFNDGAEETMTYFSANISLVALVVAIMALITQGARS